MDRVVIYRPLLSNHLARWAQEMRLPCGCSTSGDIAIYSPCRRYRFILTRTLSDEPRVLAGIGLNPSTATAFVDDRTIGRGKGFARSWGCGLYVMLNAYAWRDTEPAEMWAAARRGEDVAHPMNDLAIAYVLGQLMPQDIALAAWGGHAKDDRVAAIAAIASRARVPLQCLGTNQDGSPVHPLYQPASKKPVAWKAA